MDPHRIQMVLSMKWPYFQKYINQITLNHKNLQSLALPISELFILITLVVKLSLIQALLISLLYITQTWMTQLILSISVRSYLPLIRKDCYLNAWSHIIYEGLSCFCKKPENPRWSLFMFSTGFTSFNILHLFLLLIFPLLCA